MADEGTEETSTINTSTSEALIEMQPQQLGQVALIGALVGLVVWLLTLLIHQVIFVPLFCADATTSTCIGSNTFSVGIATVLGGIVGLMGLVRLAIYRPLLVVLAAAVALWGAGEWFGGMSWILAAAWNVLLYAFSYAVFTWFARLRAFPLATVAILIVVILARVAAIL